MSDEPQSDGFTPDSLRDLFENRNSSESLTDSVVPAPLVPAQPQFASRREARDAGGAARRPASRKPTGAPASQGSTTAKTVKTSKLSLRDRAAIKRLASTPPIVPISPNLKPRPKQKKQNPVKVFFVLLVIAGFVGGVALPAAASGSSLTSARGVVTDYKHAQSVKVSASIAASKVSRDSVSATSVAQLRTEKLNARLLVDAPGPRAAGDDYPWRDAGYGLSPLSYYYRQCVDFVAWRLNRDQGVTSAPWKWTWSNLTPNGGDASAWRASWIAHKWTVSKTPIVGSVAWFTADHVAYVHSISGTNVTIEEYNGEASRAYAERTIPISSVADFLYPPT